MKIRHRNRQERWPGTLPEIAMTATFILGPVLWISLTVFGLWLLPRMPGGAFCVLAAAIVCFAEWIMSLHTAMAQFTFCNAGVQVKYPMEKARFYPWDAFQQVCVCYYSKGTEMSGYPLICLVRKGEKTDHFGRWKTGSILHYRNLLCLDYSEEQLQEIKHFCPYDVPDFRGKGNYRM